MLKKAAALFLIGASLATWGGCSGTISNHFVYAALPAPNQILAYREDPNSGILTALTVSPIAAGPGVQSIAIHPSNKFLYAANSAEGDISLYAISTQGVLTEKTPRKSAGANVTTPTLLVIDKAGSFLYVGNADALNPSISVFSIGSDGTLNAVQGSPFQIGIVPLNIKIAPSGNVLYVTGPGSVNNPGYLEVWTVSSGALTNLIQVVNPGTNPYGMALSPNGSYLYTANTGDNSISEYTISPTDGSLTPINGSPIGETYTSPLSLFIESSGKYLYVANEGSTNIAAFSIGSDGSLTVLTSSPFAAGAQPSFITGDPNGKYLFVGNQSNPAVESFSIDTSSGSLTLVYSYPAGNTPTSIAVTQ
jgi:6-phosphogluconolactonase (cycloisomerase 2 family)